MRRVPSDRDKRVSSGSEDNNEGCAKWQRLWKVSSDDGGGGGCQKVKVISDYGQCWVVQRWEISDERFQVTTTLVNGEGQWQ
ncbi:hypothetical protein SESBI_07844 [Sesbania bispinosa]|nr:hypothetical protein SESBI_07844 [Sesbania bispinosa]